MATYSFNQKKTRELQTAIQNAPEGYEAFFQPTHHRGCVQVLRFTDKEKYKTDYCVNTFRSRDINHEAFYKKLSVTENDVLELSQEWIDMILKAKRLKFYANKRKGRVIVRLRIFK